MIMLIQDHNHRSNLTIKKHLHGWGQESWPKGVPGQNPKKRGVRGGSQKSPNFAHGGEIWGGVFLGGSRKTGVIKHGVL